MAIRQVREIGDDILTKQCKDVPRMTLRTKILIGDMLETMYEYHGVGLAAPQVGVLKRIVVIQSLDSRDISRADRRVWLPERALNMGDRDKTGSCEVERYRS